MRSPGMAIVWTIWSRHRTGFMASALILPALAMVNRLLTGVVPAEPLVTGLALTLVFLFAHVLNALLFVERAGNLSSRYPRFMLALPVRTRTLALWPMMLGSLCAGLLWVATALLISRPGGIQLPVLVPSLGLAAMMAWAQALAWMPIAVFWLREVMNIASVAALGALPIWLRVVGDASRGRIAALLAGYIASACVLGCAAVDSDRRGQTWRFWPERWPFARRSRFRKHERVKRPFRSAFAAQVWYEWNCHGLMLNGFVGAGLFWVWGVLILSGRQGSPQWFATIIVILLIMVVAFIASTSASFGRFCPFWSQSRRFKTFVQVRPMTTFWLVVAKFRMGAASVLLSWALAVALTAVWIFASGNRENAAGLVRELLDRNPPPARGLAIIMLSCVLFPALSWRMLTGPVTPVLAGSRWVDQGAVCWYLSLIVGLAGGGFWLANHPRDLLRFYSTLPWLVASLAILKGAAALAAFRAARRHRLMSWRQIVAVVSLWLAFTGCAVALSILIGPTSAVAVPSPILALGAASIVPLVRFPLATLALDWNRHR